MKKIFLALTILMSFACSPGVTLCKNAAACNDEISDAELDRCIEDVQEAEQIASNFDNEECDAFLEADHDVLTCFNANGECNSDGIFTTTQCDDEIERYNEETDRILEEDIDCDG